MLADDNQITIEDAQHVLLSEITEKRYSINLTCPGCGEEKITEGGFYVKNYGGMTFGAFLEKLTSTLRKGCGRRGLSETLTYRPSERICPRWTIF